MHWRAHANDAIEIRRHWRYRSSQGWFAGAIDPKSKNAPPRTCRFLGYEFTSPSTAIAALPNEWLIGTPEQVARQLEDLESLGVAKVILWPPLHDDLEMVNLIGREVVPAVVSR